MKAQLTLREQLEAFFITYVFVCGECEHDFEEHYWNGAGNSYCGGYDACKVNGCSCTDPRQERKKQVDETALEKCLAMAEDYAKEKVNGYLAEIHEFCYGTRDIGSIVSGHKIPTPDALQDLLCQLEVVE